MSSPEEIADRSMDLAGAFLESARQEIVEMSKGNYEVLKEAADLVRNKARDGSALSHSAEHLAFSVITAANASLIEGREKPK